MNMLAMIDGNYRIVVYSVRCGGATHDGLVLEISKLREYIQNGKLINLLRIATDDA